MGRAYLLIILAVIFLLILSLSKITLRLRYHRRGKDDNLVLDFSLWRGLFNYKFEIPFVKMQAGEVKTTKKGPGLGSFLRPVLRPAFKFRAEVEGKTGRLIAEKKKKVPVPSPAKLIDMFVNAIRQFKKYYPVVVFLFERVKLRRFQWQTEIGTGEPSQTGVLVGTAWGLKGFLLSLAYRLFSTGGTKPVIYVSPNFEKACFNTFLDCIFEVRIGYIILTGFKALIVRFK